VFKNKIIGRYFIDFLIENKLIVEFKVGNQIKNQHIQQVLAYLKTNNLRLGLIALFTEKGVKIKRIIN
jgi:GxxExxY protein